MFCQEALRFMWIWENDDTARLFCNGHEVGHYNHDLHGRDGLEAIQTLVDGMVAAFPGSSVVNV